MEPCCDKSAKWIKLQINEGAIYEHAVPFISELFLRVAEDSAKTSVNTYYHIDSIASIRTYSAKDD